MGADGRSGMGLNNERSSLDLLSYSSVRLFNTDTSIHCTCYKNSTQISYIPPFCSFSIVIFHYTHYVRNTLCVGYANII